MEPITIRYRIEKQDLQTLRLAHAEESGFSIIRCLLTWLVPAVGVTVITCFLCKDPVTRWAVVLAMLALLLYAFHPWLMILWQRVRSRNESAPENTLVIAEEGIRGTNIHAEWQVRWEQIGGWKVSEGTLLAFEAQSKNCHIIPRRAFATQEDYNAVCGLLTRKIGPPK